MIDSLRQLLRKLREHILSRHTCLTGQFVEGVRPERLAELVRRNGLVLAASNPRVDQVALAAVAKLIDDAVQAPTRDKATEKPAEPPAEKTTTGAASASIPPSPPPAAELIPLLLGVPPGTVPLLGPDV